MIAKMTLGDSLRLGATKVKDYRDRRAQAAEPTAFQRDEKGQMIPVQRAGEAEKPGEMKKVAAEPEKKEEKPAAAPAASTPAPAVAPLPAGRPSIVTGKTGESPTAGPQPSPAVSAGAPGGAPGAPKPGMLPGAPKPGALPGAPASGQPSAGPTGAPPGPGGLTVPPKPGETARRTWFIAVPFSADFRGPASTARWSWYPGC